jgi:predicted ester cyclase
LKDEALERARRFWEDAFNGRNLDLVEEFVTPAYVNHNALPGTPPGPEGQRQLMTRLWEAFPDGRFEIEYLARDGDTVICIGVMSGTHEGTLMGVPATGRRAEWRQCHLFRVDADGRALDHNAIRDDVGLMRQLGAAPDAS